jgi:cytidylate kinase
LIIAIDGPAGSGKSTTARAVARELGFFYIDTGAMYRAFGLAFMRRERDLTATVLERLLKETTIELVPDPDNCRVLLDGEDVTDSIRSSEVAQAASIVATQPAVRTYMVELQRRAGRQAVATLGGAVLEGRDIGTVVFPKADLKIFLEASLEERARRRLSELQHNGATLEEIKRQLEKRDALDSERKVSPLKVADDAVSIDTTDLTIEQQVGQIVALARDLIHSNR